MKLDRKSVMLLVAEKGLTQAKLAELSGLHPSMISVILANNTRNVYLSTIGKIAKALDVSVESIITDQEEA